MKKSPILFLSIVFMTFILFNQSVFAADIVKDKLSSGVVGANHSAPGKTLKVIVEKGSKKYTYSLRNDGKTDYYPLQSGSGDYSVKILENVSGTRYSVLKAETVTATIANANSTFLQPIQIINYTNNDPAIVKAQNLGNNNKIYDYVVKNTKYDYAKAETVKPGYFPVVNETFSTKKGICYDYSSMNAAMNRSSGVPTKLVKGYAKGVDGYHAWNEVFVDGKWQVVDTTYDSAKKANTTMFKKSSDYQKVFEY